jgi:prepilin-type N-terminal cleavage/methylation domain-containing protein
MTPKKNQKNNKGMTYVELIVVLTIFSVISGITIFDYKKFEHRVEIKDLASIIASKIIEAQKNAQAGRKTSDSSFTGQDSSGKNRKPAYGIRFDSTLTPTPPSPNASFIYFADLDNSADYDVSSTCGSVPAGECLEKVEIYKGYRIKEIEISYLDPNISPFICINSIIDITFKRSDPNVGFNTSCNNNNNNISEVKIKISLPTQLPEISAIISVHKSGRIQIN